MATLAGTLQPPGTQLVESATVFDGPVTFTTAAPITSSGAITTTGAVTSSGALTGQSLNGTGTASTPAPVTAGAGVGSTTTLFKGHDLGGSFVLTTAGTPAAGVVATITFGTALAAAPVSVVVSAVDTTASPNTVINVGAGSLATTGFSISSTALTAAHAYLISYVVVAS